MIFIIQLSAMSPFSSPISFGDLPHTRTQTHRARTHANDRIQYGQRNEHREPILIRPSPWWSAVDVMRAQRT